MIKKILNWRMFVATLMGFSAGLPLLLTGSLLQAWMVKEQIDLKTIGLFALVGLPYTLKFLWAPIFDRFSLPFLGRRKGWLIVSQVLVTFAIILLACSNPTKHPILLACSALILTFFSASQDIIIDAYRREAIVDEELGLAASLYVNGYRIGMLLASGGGLILSAYMSFKMVYLLMACFMLIGIVTTIFAPNTNTAHLQAKSFEEAVIKPFSSFFSRQDALWVLLFMLLYKVGDSMASQMTMPFYLAMGFDAIDIGIIVKLYGFWATIIGGLIGGILMIRWGIFKSLVLFGLLQGLSTACFIFLLSHQNLNVLAAIISFENISSGMGTTAFIAFMASITDKHYTATQYALLTSLMGVPRVFLAAPTGYMVEQLGWFNFYLFCASIAIFALFLITWLHQRGSDHINA